MAFGVVISDAEGKKAGCCYGFRPGAVSVMEGEATAVLEGVRLCTEKGLSDVIIEMDCQRLYWSLVNKKSDPSYLGTTLDIIWSAAMALQRCSFSWTSREGNEDADCLAKYALCNRLAPSSVEVFPFLLNSFSS
ncbi:uncharacterized protein LOC131003602 [Salvia miltiorrhiza]|uniref:uncharacterized protein LOC131003602 n=1 Tax=Salvia miltiorrhiza TaxID=226208 RepID=UPI0025AC80BE|nr:uncharacterized protein LOC131003602 [Salvia miltiorrhiza]